MYTDTTPPITSTQEVLDGLSGVRDQMRLLDRGLVILAVEWAKHHPTPTAVMPAITPAPGPYDYQRIFDEIALGGAVSFDDDAVTEFAIAVGMTEHSARKLIRESIMLVHYLPRVWSRVLAGGLDVWRARNLAGDCFGLSPSAIAFVDSQMAQSTARITATSRERLIQEARKLHMPEMEESHEEEVKAKRCAEVLLQEQEQGVVPMQAVLDLPDALALEAAISAGAQALEDAGSDAPLSIRRSWALGDLARGATGEKSLFSSHPEACGCECHSGLTRPHWNGKGAAPASVKVFVHLNDETFTSSDHYSPPGQVQGTGIRGTRICTPESIREWFTRPTLAGAFTPKVLVRPTLDRSEEISSDAYEPPERAHEHVQLSHSSCIFPFCTRPAHVCDADHTIPWKPGGTGGATCTCNLVSLCRTHHRLKTHGDNAPTAGGQHNVWSYTNLGGGKYYWKGPRDWAFIRTNTGTYDAAQTPSGAAPRHPGLLATNLETTEDLIATLLHKASLTRGMHHLDLNPLWQIPSAPASEDHEEEEPPSWWDDDDGYIGPNMFLMINTPFPHAA